MGTGRLSIWVRDTEHPCLPYQSTAHTWYAAIVTCDLQPLAWGAVQNGIFKLNVRGKLGGMVHGQVEVPPGCYIVIGFATCKNILTDWATVQVGCGEEVCVNLLPRTLTRCTGEILYALNVASVLGPAYSPSCPAMEIPAEVIRRSIHAMEELRKYLPEDRVLPALPITLEELLRMAKEEN